VSILWTGSKEWNTHDNQLRKLLIFIPEPSIILEISIMPLPSRIAIMRFCLFHNSPRFKPSGGGAEEIGAIQPEMRDIKQLIKEESRSGIPLADSPALKGNKFQGLGQ
jgi:hypothetical protein